MKFFNILFIFLLTLLVACSEKQTATTEKKQESTATADAHEHGNEVSVTDAQMKMAGIELGEVTQKNLSTALAVNGTLDVPNQNKAFVTTLITGTVRALHVHPGDFVRKGQVLATVASPQVADLQQQMVRIQSQANYTRNEVSRMKELVSGNAAPLKSLQRAESELQGLEAQLSGLKQQLHALGASASGNISSVMNVTAPIGGSVSDVYAEIGSQVDASTPIAQITNNAELHLDLFVYEKDLSKISIGQAIHFTLTNNPGKVYDARIYAIGTAFANETKAVPVHAHVINDKRGLIEGMSVHARVSLGEGSYPAVPEGAIVSFDNKDFVFVMKSDRSAGGQNAGYSFERVQLFRGASDMGFTEIKPITPIPVGTRVATKGAFFLMAMLTNEGEHEH